MADQHITQARGTRMSEISPPNFVVGGTSRYAAMSETLQRGARVTARTHHGFDALFYVDSGALAFMVDGFEGIVAAGGFVRVAAGSWYAYRNGGAGTATLLSRLVPAQGLSVAEMSLGIERAA